MRLFGLAGERTTAVAQFSRFAKLARSELGVEPDEQTLALLGRIQNSSVIPEPRDWLRTETAEVLPDKVPLIGRREEEASLLVAVEAALRGLGGGALILGEPGIGKSRLADWLAEEWASRGGGIGFGRCIEFNEPVPYQPLLDAVSGIIDTGELTEFVQRGQSALDNALNPAVLVGIQIHESAAGSDYTSGKLRLFAWLRSRLENAARQRPLLLIVEDFQWIDVGTLDFLTYLLSHCRHMRVLVVLTARIGGTLQHVSRVDRLSRHASTVVHVRSLSKSDTEELVRLFFRPRGITRGLLDWIYEETEGNPLFVIETLRLLQQRGGQNRGRDLSENEGSLPFKHPEMPEGVRSTVRQRLALLDPGALRIAQIASVLGRSFEEELLELVSGSGTNRLSRAVSSLVRAGIFEREDAGYRFAHDKIRAVCYEGVSARAKRRYHARAAAVLASSPDVPAHKLAWHQDSAGQWALAAASWESAGDQAAEIHAYEEAIRAYRRAVHCARTDGVRTDSRDGAEASVLFKLDAVMAILGMPRERREVLERVTVLCRRRQPKARSMLLVRRASLEEHVGDFASAARLAREACSVARTAGDRPGEVEALRILAWVLNRAGRHRRSLQVSVLAIRKIENRESPVLVSTLWQAAAVYVKLSNYARASELLERAVRIAVDLGLRSELWPIIGTQAVVDIWTGRVLVAQEGLLKATQLAVEAGNPLGATRAAFHLAALHRLGGRLGDSLLTLRRATVSSRSMGYMRTFLACLNEVAYGIGRLLANYHWAWKALTRAMRMAEASGSRVLMAMCKDSQTLLLLDEGRFDEAMVAINEVLSLQGNEPDSLGPNQESVTLRGVIWLGLDDAEKALEDLELASRLQAERGDRLILVDSLTYRAIAYAKLGNLDRALESSLEAVNLLTELGHANMQPQRVFWHHYLILKMAGREPRLPYLKRAVELIDAQASTLSRSQQRRLREAVPLNREILTEWRHIQPPDERHENVRKTARSSEVARLASGQRAMVSPVSS